MVIAVLFVCTGNICRSPSAEGVFRELIAREKLVDHIDVASAGTHGWHVGNPPDPRSIEAALRRGVDIRAQRSRQFKASDYDSNDYVLAMDEENMRFLKPTFSADARAHLAKFLTFAPHLGEEDVPDPYYGEGNGFETVLDMIEAASEGLLADIRASGKLT